MTGEYTIDKKLLEQVSPGALERLLEGGHINGSRGYIPPEVRPRGRSARIEKSAVLGYWVYSSERGVGEPWWRLTRTGATKRARKYIDAVPKQREAWVIR